MHCYRELLSVAPVLDSILRTHPPYQIHDWTRRPHILLRTLSLIQPASCPTCSSPSSKRTRVQSQKEITTGFKLPCRWVGALSWRHGLRSCPAVSLSSCGNDQTKTGSGLWGLGLAIRADVGSNSQTPSPIPCSVAVDREHFTPWWRWGTF